MYPKVYLTKGACPNIYQYKHQNDWSDAVSSPSPITRPIEYPPTVLTSFRVSSAASDAYADESYTGSSIQISELVRDLKVEGGVVLLCPSLASPTPERPRVTAKSPHRDRSTSHGFNIRAHPQPSSFPWLPSIVSFSPTDQAQAINHLLLPFSR
jgi:hypothetical protein